MVLKLADTKLPLHFVQKMMRTRLGLKHKKIKRIPFHGNSEKNLVLRQ